MRKIKDPSERIVDTKTISYYGLIGIFAMLLVQSAIPLFVKTSSSEGMLQIDIVLRTAMSSLFGYIISRVSVGNNGNKNSQPPNGGAIGFSTNNIPNQPNILKMGDEIEKTKKEEEKLKRIEKEIKIIEIKKVKRSQVIILVSICIFCLTIMMIVRNFSHIVNLESKPELTISQYRDIISGSIGALISLSKGE